MKRLFLFRRNGSTTALRRVWAMLKTTSKRTRSRSFHNWHRRELSAAGGSLNGSQLSSGVYLLHTTTTVWKVRSTSGGQFARPDGWIVVNNSAHRWMSNECRRFGVGRKLSSRFIALHLFSTPPLSPIWNCQKSWLLQDSFHEID